MFDFFERRRREKIRERPFPAEWRAILERGFPLYGRLTPENRAELEGHVQVFLEEKSFEGAGGLEMTDEIRVTVAAQACVLLLHRDTDYYPRMKSVVVYPRAYLAAHRSEEGGIVTEGHQARLGESWSSGAVVLSWGDVRAGARDLRDGHNVVFHEFAHQLDLEDGGVDGVPELEGGSAYRAWARVFSAEYLELRADARKGRRSVLDDYGATEPAEFFAVATEAFFEKPRSLRSKHPELYAELAAFFQQDPAETPVTAD
jgi:hypothetical protein